MDLFPCLVKQILGATSEYPGGKRYNDIISRRFGDRFVLLYAATIYMPAWMAIKARIFSTQALHDDNDHAGAVPEDILSCFKVLKKCRNKFDCLVNETLYIKQLTLSLNVQTDNSVRAKGP